jgi:hypothetical protein
MKRNRITWVLVGTCAATFLLLDAAASTAQYRRRYEPSRPTVSPYLNLFRFNNSVLPNYQALVRPQLQERAFEQQQQQLNRRQLQAINQLQSNVQTLQQAPVTAPLVAPTGKGSWFQRDAGNSTFLNTSRYYSQSGGGSPAGGGGRR